MIKTIKGNLMGLHRGDEVDIIVFDTFWVELRTDPDDGFRSYLEDAVIHQEEPLPDDVTKFYTPIAPATLYYHADNLVRGETLAEDSYDMVRVIGDDGYVWLEAGTSYDDEWYPFAYIGWNPREPE